ncbi:MAG: DUF4175 family protein [Cyclobacteriaceae bacterium]
MGEFGLMIEKLRKFKKKYYLNQLLKGVILSTAIIISLLLIFSALEFNLRFNSPVRAFLFFTFVASLVAVTYFWIVNPLIKLFNNNRQISDEEAAIEIGRYFPEVSDKLLNTIQLQNISSKDNTLILASIEQRIKQIGIVRFSDAVDLGYNKRYLKYLAVPTAVMLLMLLFVPQMLTESTTRILRYDDEFLPVAPFSFNLLNEDLTGFKNEDFTVELGFDGSAIPNQAYLNTKGRKIKMKNVGGRTFSHTFRKLQSATDFTFEAAGFSSSNYDLKLVSRPNLKNFNVYLEYPKYTGKVNENLSNVGNLEVPEGTGIKWQMSTSETESMTLNFEGAEEQHAAQLVDNQLFEFERTVFDTDNYSISLSNPHSQNKEKISYQIEVEKDEYPTINLEQFQDTVLFSYVVLGGSIADDYGLTKLQVNYRIISGKDESPEKNFNIPLQSGNSQSFFHQWRIDSLELGEGDQVQYAIQVWDNDGVNGRKSTKTGYYSFNIPTKNEIKDKLDKEAQGTQDQIDESIEKAEDLKEKLQDLEDRLKTKKELDWQDEKMIEELMKEKQDLNDELQKLRDQHKANTQQRERFNEKNEKISEKVAQLQELMDELLDEETKKLYEELKKLLEEQRGLNEVQEALDDIKSKEENLEKELERALELFKRMKMEYKMEEVINDLEELAEKQEDLAEETMDEDNPTEELGQEQEQLMEEFDDIKEDMEELNDLNQDLENPAPMDDNSEEQKDIEQNQQDSKESLEQNERQKSNQSQKKAAEQMKKMSQQMQQMQAGMEMEMMQENLDNLRDIVDNLVTLSFDQEEVLTEFKKISQSDPRFIELSQEQLKLKDDAQIIEDSLLSLAGRVFQIASFVTREVDAMNEYMDASVAALKDRNKSQAVSSQQFAMTSMNNLALLLDDVLQNMQQMMADAMGNPKAGQKKGKKNMPGMSQLQQELNNRIEDLKKSGKSGRELSEELAKLAAQQEMIRESLEEMERKLQELNGEEGEDGAGGNVGDILKKMEQTELDLVNKQLTDNMIRRQRDILTRLLESEKALRERELDEEREGQQAEAYDQILPQTIEEYLKAKEKEIELLKTVPPKLNPYYKKEVNDYFRRLGSQ